MTGQLATRSTRRIKIGVAAALIAVGLTAFVSSAALAASTLTTSAAEKAVSKTVAGIGRSVVKADKLSGAKVSAQATCKSSATGRFTCGYTITIMASPTSAFCTGVANAAGTSPIRVDPKKPKCHKIAPASATTILSVGAAQDAIRTWAKSEIANTVSDGTVITDVGVTDCTRQSSKAIACTWLTDLSLYDGSGVHCDEPPAIAFIKTGSSLVYVTGTFDVGDCNGGGFNVG